MFFVSFDFILAYRDINKQFSPYNLRTWGSGT